MTTKLYGYFDGEEFQYHPTKATALKEAHDLAAFMPKDETLEVQAYTVRGDLTKRELMVRLLQGSMWCARTETITTINGKLKA